VAAKSDGQISQERLDTLPDHVTLSFNKSWLDAYQPRLILGQDDEKFLGLYSVRATSPEYDTDVAIYWSKYTHQSGVTSYDSHWGDHEPCYCYVDSDTGELQTVVASVYHWLSGKATAATVPTNGNQPILRVINPWHQYTAGRESPRTQEKGVEKLLSESELLDIDVETKFEQILNNGLDEDLAFGSVLNPWIMLVRDSWWQRNTWHFSSTESYVKFSRKFGRQEAGSLEG